MHPRDETAWRIHYECPGCRLGQLGSQVYYGENYTQAEADALSAEQNSLQETDEAREAIRTWRDEVERRDAPHIQRFWKAFELAFPAWMSRVEHLPVTQERRASMEKYLYCLSLTFYTRRENTPPRLELRADVMRGEVRLDPMHQHFDDDRDPGYLESALKEIQEHFEQEWARSRGAQTLDAYLDSLILESYQSTSPREES